MMNIKETIRVGNGVGRAIVSLVTVARGALAVPCGHLGRSLPGEYKEDIWVFCVPKSRWPVWLERLWGV